MPLIDGIRRTCESCEAGPEDKHKVVGEKPTMEQLEEWVYDSVAEATDGCIVEPDGRCEHGHASWLLAYGLI
jgi:hypothetical protein